MAQFLSFDPNVEIIGQNVLGFIECSNQDSIRPLLKQHGLTDVKPDQWYPLQLWLDILSDISNQSGAMQDFVSIGVKIAETAVYPPQFANLSFEEILMQSNTTYQLQHRNGYAGEQTTEKLGDKHLLLTMKTPYPDDLAYGVVWGQARHFLPRGTQFTIQYDTSEPRGDEGGEYTRLDITWE
jgi:hypothetical protein